MMNDTVIGWTRDADSIVVLTLDAAEHQAANTITSQFHTSLGAVVDRLEAEQAEIAGVVVTSAKSTYSAGIDLNVLVEHLIPLPPKETLAVVTQFSLLLRRLERIGRPVVAAINGTNLGGGMELALACHHRIAVDVPGARLGLPEVHLGLSPGAGGIGRVVRMIGVQNALTQVLLTGSRMTPSQAQNIGLIDEIVSNCEQLVPAAKKWITTNPDRTVQPWDAGGHATPAGSPSSSSFAAELPALPANLHKRLKGNTHVAAPRAIMAAAVEGAQVDFDNALTIEARYFVSLVKSPVSRNMIQTFFDLESVERGAARPKGIERTPIEKVGILSARRIGAGIGDFAGVDIIAEAVAKNVGLTSDETLSRAIDYTQSVDKQPIGFSDSRGSFITRVLSMWLLEAMTMLTEGIDPASIEQAAHQAGYAVPPLQVADELSFGTVAKIIYGATNAANIAGAVDSESAAAAHEVLSTMTDACGRHGKLSSAGFYDYVDSRRIALWNGLRDQFQTCRELAVPLSDLQDRFIFIQVLETQKCVDDGILDADADADVGSIFGMGFPAWTGGVRQFITGHPGGPTAFTTRADELALRHGARFHPPERLRKPT